ncbi:DUF7674 family protein [Nocardioides campestrisoli]|uniref:DUF7674 family protein n=1 Tax=Nocardioides campestrisoli TaxID=2736757 RepID=UPI0015E7CB9A|nr:hypothetical protein [Nocardioides campestrisoli]
MEDLDEFVEALYGAAPGLTDVLREADEPAPDPDFPSVWLADVGRALARLLPSLAEHQASEAFQVVERYLVRGGEFLKAAIATELLEALASEVSSGKLSGPALAAVLGPESRAYLDAWDEFTLGHSSLDPG